MPVFVSCDAVFDGSRAYWSEDDEPIPILTYGRQKLEVVERSLRDIPVLEQRHLDTSLRADRFKAAFGTPFRAAGEVTRAAVQSYFAAQDGGK